MVTDPFYVGDWEVRPLEGTIRGPAGEHHVRPKSMDVLVRLASSPGQVVERDQLINDVWGRSLISDEPLNACVADLRRALGDRRKDPRYIQTVPKRGYRLVAKVATGKADALPCEPSNVASPETPDPDPFGKPSIAVLPFDNLSGDPEERYFSDGITSDIVTQLAKFNELFVVASNSSFMFRGPNVDVKNVGAELSVKYVVEGSVRRNRERLRVTARLVEANTRQQIWAQSYDRQFADLFDIQDEVSGSIASTLLGKIEKIQAARVANKPTNDLTAYDCYLRGSYLHKNLALDDLLAAQSYFEKAIELDANFASAHSRLAGVYLTLAFFYEREEEDHVIRRAAERALRLDPDDSYGRLVLGLSLPAQQQYTLAEQHVDAALRSQRNDAELIAWTGLAFALLGQLGKARTLIQQAMERNPLQHDFYHSIVGRLAYLEGDYSGSIEAFKHSLGYQERIWDVATAAASMAQLGLVDNAREEVSRVAALLNQKSTVEVRSEDFEELLKRRLLRFKRETDRDHLLEGYRKAGLVRGQTKR